MAINFPGPYQLEFSYAVSGVTHKQNLNCQLTTDPTPGDAIDTLLLMKRGGGTVSIASAVSAWIDLLKPIYHTSVQFNDVTLWKVAALSNDRTFINTLLIDVAATSATATTIAGQEIFTFRTINGGIMKLAFMESNLVVGAAIPRASLTSYRDAIADFVESTDNWIYARDDSYPIVGLTYNPGQNEALFKRRYRTL